MSSSVDTQHSILQTSIAERVQQVQQQHPDMQQRYFENELRQERIRRLQKVNDFDSIDNIKFAGNEQRKQHGRRQQNEHDETRNPETPADANQPTHINIKV